MWCPCYDIHKSGSVGSLDIPDWWHHLWSPLDETVHAYDWQPLLWGRLTPGDEIAIALWRDRANDVFAQFSHPTLPLRGHRFAFLWLLRHPLGWMALLRDRDWLLEPDEGGPVPQTIIKIPSTLSLGRSNSPAQTVTVLTAEEFQEVLPWFVQDIMRSRVHPYKEWQEKFLVDMQTVFGPIPMREKF